MFFCLWRLFYSYIVDRKFSTIAQNVAHTLMGWMLVFFLLLCKSWIHNFESKSKLKLKEEKKSEQSHNAKINANIFWLTIGICVFWICIQVSLDFDAIWMWITTLYGFEIHFSLIHLNHISMWTQRKSLEWKLKRLRTIHLVKKTL